MHPPLAACGERSAAERSEAERRQTAEGARRLWLELVLPCPDLGEHLGGWLARHADRGGHVLNVRAQERVRGLLFGDRGRDRRLFRLDLVCGLRGARLEGGIVRLDRLGKTDVGERVFVSAEDARL